MKSNKSGTGNPSGSRRVDGHDPGARVNCCFPRQIGRELFRSGTTRTSAGTLSCGAGQQRVHVHQMQAPSYVFKRCVNPQKCMLWKNTCRKVDLLAGSRSGIERKILFLYLQKNSRNYRRIALCSFHLNSQGNKDFRKWERWWVRMGGFAESSASDLEVFDLEQDTPGINHSNRELMWKEWVCWWK